MLDIDPDKITTYTIKEKSTFSFMTQTLKWEMSNNGNFDQIFFTLPSAPNRFHRTMQKWILGIHWRRKQKTPGG